MSRLADWLTAHQPKAGYLLGALSAVTSGWERISIAPILNRRVRRQHHPEHPDKAPRWVSELVVVACIGIGALYFALVQPVESSPLLCVLAIWPLYRVLDLLLFVIAWIFVHTAPLFSAQRSLLGFVLNIVELNLVFGVLNVLVTKEIPPSRLDYLMHRITEFATLNGSSAVGLSSLGGALELLWVFASLLLMLVVIGSLAGGVIRHTVNEASRE